MSFMIGKTSLDKDVAAFDQIAKTIDILRNLQIQDSLAPDDYEAKKKEKIANCLVLTNGVTLLNVKAVPQILNLSIETLLCLCDDSDSDVRTVADESLNKIIKAMDNSYILKVQFLLYREINRNGAPRCLRAALWRFGLLSHLIRPVKVKVFASKLTPCILKIVNRKEDVVIETLSQSLPLILKTLGHYIPDKDIQILLETLFKNFASSEAIHRRASANMILTACLNSRKPQQFLNYVIEQLIDMLFQIAEGDTEIEEVKEESTNRVFGVFACLRLILPCIDSNSNLNLDFNEDHILDYYICIYKLCLFYAELYSNHNMINAALETLGQLLQNPPKHVVVAFLSPEGISQRINKLKERGEQWTSRISLLMTVMSEENLESSSNLFESDMDISNVAPKVEDWMTNVRNDIPIVHKAQSNTNISDSSEIIETKDLGDYSSLIIGCTGNEEMDSESNASSDIEKLEKPVDIILPSCEDTKEYEDYEETSLPSISVHEFTFEQFMTQRNDLMIGNIMDNDVPLRFCCRFIVSSFLLTGVSGELISDKYFRVSVKSLALTCLGNVFRLYPDIFFETVAKVFKSYEHVKDKQVISDILKFIDHSDPQIRGNVSMIIGCLLQGILTYNKGYFHLEYPDSSITVKHLINLILMGLEDESATTCHHTLNAISIFLPSLLESEKCEYAIPVLKVLPNLVKNPYFLVKIKLAEILSELPYTTIEHVNKKLKFQDSILNVLLKLLSDLDQRVRKAASNAITKIIPTLYLGSPYEDSVTRKASLYMERFLVSIVSSPVNPTFPSYIENKLLISSLVEPHSALFRVSDCISRERIDEALSRVIGLLVDNLLVFSSKYFAYGCCEALSMLSEAYLTTLYPRAWDCFGSASKQVVKKPMKKLSVRGEIIDNVPGFSNEVLSPISSSLFSQTIILLTSSPLSLDLSMHRHLLLLAGNIASGIACTIFWPREQQANLNADTIKSDSEAMIDYKCWILFKNKQNSWNMEQLLKHVLRVLNIFQHVIEDLGYPIQPVSKYSLPSLPTAQSVSPKRRLLSDQSSKLKINSSTDKSSEHHRVNSRFGGKDQFGCLTGQSHYLRLYKLLKAAHSNYCVTLQQEASEMYLALLNANLQVLSQILEVASINEVDKVAEEILHYLQSTMLLSPTKTVQCVRQLLKCLFGANLLAKWFDIYKAQCRMEKNDTAFYQKELTKEEAEFEKGFYEQCFQRPAKFMAERIKEIGRNCRGGNEPDSNRRFISSLLRKKIQRSDQNSVNSLIRLFEPLVIKSLMEYTFSNSASLQCQVLVLLSQLVQLHINYCLMDSDKVFIDFIMKQLEFIEDGCISNTEELLPKIFDFLVRLSYEKYHSKLIISVPKIIQLCDGLMASGQSPLTHCIPALVPVVEEMFLVRNSLSNMSKEKEMETTREVLMSMMLRLVEYHQIAELLSKCLTESRLSNDGNGEEKWRRWSRQIMDAVIPLLLARKIRLESKQAYIALVQLFAAVSPTVFRPVDPLLKVLLTIPPSHNVFLTSKDILELKRWMGMVNVIILSLVSYAKEEVMLSRLSDISSSIIELPEILLIPDSSRPTSGDPLNASGLLEPLVMPPERILSRFIFRVIGSMSVALIDIFQGKNLKVLLNAKVCDENDYMIQQFSLFLQLCIHMFETGSHCKVANASMQLVQGENITKDERLLLHNLNDSMIQIGTSCPIFMCQWTYLLTLLGFDDMSFWSRVIGPSSIKNQTQQQLSMNAEILRRTSIILFCDYACENASLDLERLGWLLRNHVTTTISLADEPPVQELLAVAMHREPESSSLLLRAVVEECECRIESRPEAVRRLLRCLEGTNQSQSGQLLLVIVPRLLRTKYLALSRMAAKIASRRLELLLALGRDEALTQITRDEIKGIMEALKYQGLARKYGALVSLLNKLATSHYELQPLELDYSKPFNPVEVKKIPLDRAWFLSQVTFRCCHPCVSYGCLESAWLLSHLNLDECLEIFSSKYFNVKLLHECVIVGTRLTTQATQEMAFNSTAMAAGPKESTLYIATKQNLMLRVRRILQELPKSYEPYDISAEQEDNNLSNNQLSEEYQQALISIAPAIASYIDSLAELSLILEPEYGDEFARLALLCLEVGRARLNDRFSPRELDLMLICARAILRQPEASRSLSNSKNNDLFCSAVAAIDIIVRYCCSDKPPLEANLECSGLREAMADGTTRKFGIACAKMAALVDWLKYRRMKKNSTGNGNDIPNFLAKSLDSLIISMARQPLVNSFVLTPSLLWKHGSPIVGAGSTKCQFALLSSEPNYIPELDVLEEFIFRISLLGWNSRQQFEEIWMVLLGVLNVSQINSEEKTEVTCNLGHSASLAVRAITNLLVQTLILPCPGNPNNGSPIQHPRDPQLSLHRKSSQRLFAVQDLLLWKYKNNTLTWSVMNLPKLEHIFNRGNLEPHSRNYVYGQLSTSYLWSLCSLHEDKLSFSTIALKKRRDEALNAASLDVNSCLRFLLDLYATWMSPASKIPLKLLHEVVKSLLFVSELFVERSQYQWMLESCLELWKVHLSEDELIRKHLIVAICKACAVLTPLDTDTLEKVKRLIDGCLKCDSLCMRIATLHGILYLLQSAVLANCEETMSAIHPLTIEYIQRYINAQDFNRVSNQSEEHQSILWVLVFFLLEHGQDIPSDVEAPAVLELILSLVCSQKISVSLHQMLLQGLERLVATKSVIGKVSEQIILISIERLRQMNPAISLPALQLFLTCMYTDTADRFNQPELDEPLPDIEPEVLVKLIERSSVIFDKIKKGYPAEVQILCAVLSEVLIDFFPPMDIITKVIGEFLSPQQPHPRLMSAIVFKVCERACNSTQLGLLQAWVVFSIQNFIQSLPLIMSTWCLSCFFISTSTNPWLRALFPHVQSRIGKYEFEDKKILCLAAFDFYSKLTNESQKKTFIKTFEDAAKNLGNPFTDILASF